MNRKRLSPSTILLIIGFLLIISGFAYLVIFVNIPYQDPTPEMISKENFHWGVGNNIMLTGGIFLVIGLMWSLAKFVIRLFKKK